MRTIPLSEITNLEPKESVPAIEGTITDLFKPKTGDGQYGPWLLQDFKLSDGTAEVTCCWTANDHDAGLGNEWKGREVRIESGRDGKGVLAGLKIEEREYKGKVYRKIKIDDRAKIMRQGQGTSQDDAPHSQSSQPDKAPPASTSRDYKAAAHAIRDRQIAAGKLAKQVCEALGVKFEENGTATYFGTKVQQGITIGLDRQNVTIPPQPIGEDEPKKPEPEPDYGTQPDDDGRGEEETLPF